ncbi:MAG: MFS transporter, partial [Cyclobacteriaceae bacterium]
GAFLIPFTNEFYLHAILWSLTGIGMTFSSGSEEALVIDNLNKIKRKDLHHEYFIKSNSFIKLGSIFAPIIGAILVKSFTIDVLWYVFAIGHLISAVVIWLFTSEATNLVKLPPLELIKKSYQTSKMGIAFAFRHRVIRYFIIAGLFVNLMMVSNLGMQPLLVELGMEEYQLGYLYSITALVNIGMSFLSRKFIDKDPRNLMSVVVLIVMILLLSLMFVYPPFFYIACFIFIMRDGMFNFGMPVLFTYVHQYIPEKIRATTISAKSMLDQLVIALAYVGAGSLMDVFGPKYVLAFTGLFGIIVIYFYQKMREKNHN